MSKTSTSFKFCSVCRLAIDDFLPGGVKIRNQVKCPQCGSRERYRLLALYLEKETDFFTKKNQVLEIGPDKGFADLCKSSKNITYRSIDLLRHDVAESKMDVTDLDFNDNEFDYIICYHVLEHVEDDETAVEQIYRVLKVGGMALISVPVDVNRMTTYEDEQVDTELERINVFGQRDHVRIYGNDFIIRLKQAGFKVDRVKYVEHFSKFEKEKYGIKDRYQLSKYETDEDIYVCKK